MMVFFYCFHMYLLFKNDPFLCLLFRFLLEIIPVYFLFKKTFFLLSIEITYTQKLIKAFVEPKWQGLSKTTLKSALLCISKESLFRLKLELSICPIMCVWPRCPGPHSFICYIRHLFPLLFFGIILAFVLHGDAYTVYYLYLLFILFIIFIFESVFTFFQDFLSCINPKKCLFWL